MEIQQMSICTQSLQKMLADPKKYRKIMMIIMQTLYNLGYQETAKQLQLQSNITYVSQQLKILQVFLNSGNFLQAVKQIDKINSQNFDTQKKEKIKQTIYQSECLRLMIQGNLQEALKVVQIYIKDQNSKQKLCEMLVLGSSQQISKESLQKQIVEDNFRKNNSIYCSCLQYFQSIGKNQIDKVIQSYGFQQHEGKRDIKRLFNIQKQYPPNRLLTSEESQHFDKPITHIKINQGFNEVICVSQTKNQKQIAIFEINFSNINTQKAFKNNNISTIRSKYPIFNLKKKSKIVNLQYFGQKQTIQSIQYFNQSIIICTYALIMFFNRDLQQICRIASQDKSERNLFIDLDPFSNLIYTSGYYTKLKVYDQKGQQMNQIQPFPKTRKFIFSNQNFLIGINCVTPKIFKYNIYEQKVEVQKQIDFTIMDICYNSQKQIVAVSTFRNIQVLNSVTLQLIFKCPSPQNPAKVLIQLSFYNTYLIVLCKNFKAYKGSQDMKNFSLQKQWPGQGIFDINKNIMISGNKQLLCWTQGNIDYDKYEQFSEQEQEDRYQDLEQLSEQSEQQEQNQDQNSDSEVDLELS